MKAATTGGYLKNNKPLSQRPTSFCRQLLCDGTAVCTAFGGAEFAVIE